ncbi:MAG: pyruvate kinase [Bacteroidales bacterium]|nr:pyruvate kinase [Bacteroidales bacterium]
MEKTAFLLTKIIATLGPASDSIEKIEELIKNGVRVFRINFSHGTFSEHKKLVDNIRKAEKESGLFIGILGDLPGPKIRVGEVVDEGIHVLKGQEVFFVKKQLIAGEGEPKNTFSSTFPSFIDEVVPGDRILLDDGSIELESIEKCKMNGGGALKCKVVTGGLVSSSKGINLPDTDLSVEALTARDYECVDFAVKNNFNFLALSFVQKSEDVNLLKNRLLELNSRPAYSDGFFKRNENFANEASLEKFIPVISKIEKPQAIRNLDSIIKETDGIMVARGDLGVEMDLAEVAVLQKEILQKCHEYGKPVIVATQMLQSMIHSPVPTRAEVSDVANAIFDGADAVMLSGETAVGKYPEMSAGMIHKIAKKTNKFIRDKSIIPGSLTGKPLMGHRVASIAHGVDTIARDIKPKFIVIWTDMGGSAVYLSQFRLPVPVLAFSRDKDRLRMLSVLYGITPLYLNQPKSGSDFIRMIDKKLLDSNWAKPGDSVIVVSGDPITKPGLANRIVVHYLGEGVE